MTRNCEKVMVSKILVSTVFQNAIPTEWVTKTQNLALPHQLMVKWE